jgi:hypothetical protein
MDSVSAETVHTMVELATATTELQTRFPALTESMGALSDVIGGMGLGGLAGGIGMRVATGGTVAGALGLGGGTTAAGGTGAALAGGGALAVGGAAVVGAVGYNFVNPNHTGDSGDTEQSASAAALRTSSGGLSPAARDELIRQRQALSASGTDGRLTRQVQAGLAAGQRMDPADIRALADAIGRATAEHAATPPPPSALSTGTASRRVAREAR